MSLLQFKTLLGDVITENNSSVINMLNKIQNREDEIEANLKHQLTKQCHIETKMRGITRALVILGDVEKDSNKLNVQIARTACLAESISAKVRRLDLARNRVSECQQRVHDLIDLQLCCQGVMTAIDDENFEVAASHINRFLAMDLKLLKRTADDVQGSISSVSEAIKTLEIATLELRNLILRKFNDAIKKDDIASVERFFKIFPMLGRHDEGIEKFSDYICIKLSIKANKKLRNALDVAKAEKRFPLAYADTLTTLLENFARVVEVNRSIIEAFYGSGYLVNMLEVLQRQCDIDVTNLLLEFSKTRKLGHRIQQVEERYSHGNINCSSKSSSVLGHCRKLSGGPIDKLNLKEIDTIIAEITIMHSRTELYFRFMKRRITADIKASTLDKGQQEQQLKKVDKIFNDSSSKRQMEELLGNYLLFERYFMEESVIKAITLDTCESGQLNSSMVDDVFFILRKSIRRALSSQSVNGTCAIINNAAACLESDFVNALRASLKLGYPSGYIDLTQAYNVIQSSLQQGRIQSSDNEKARIHFFVQLNNADMSTEYIETLCQTVEQEIKGTFPSLRNLESQLIESCIAELRIVRDILKACVDFGMQQLRSSSISPRLHPWVDQFLNYKHHLSEDELASYEAGETFVQFLISQIDSLLSTFKTVLTSRNLDALITIVTTELTIRLERAIKKSTFNRLGGLVLDQEVRVLGTYLASATSWSIRDKMTRLYQIATILTLENVSELNDYWKPENLREQSIWRLAPNEVKTILRLRTDFRIEDIKRIKF